MRYESKLFETPAPKDYAQKWTLLPPLHLLHPDPCDQPEYTIPLARSSSCCRLRVGYVSRWVGGITWEFFRISVMVFLLCLNWISGATWPLSRCYSIGRGEEAGSCSSRRKFSLSLFRWLHSVSGSLRKWSRRKDWFTPTQFAVPW